ncbi:hypothetical protein N7491_011234 [Penicillium cf. griseofulvum]|nr:hypothetical protein N7491_011234 [Penicillium cf. griseofulvum]
MDLVDTGRPPAEKRVRASMKKLVGRGSHLASFSRNPAYPAPPQRFGKHLQLITRKKDSCSRGFDDLLSLTRPLHRISLLSTHLSFWHNTHLPLLPPSTLCGIGFRKLKALLDSPSSDAP